MSPHSNSNRSNTTHKPAIGSVVGLLLIGVFQSASVCAEDATAFRARVIKEVLQEVPDVELAKQVVEIRLTREFIKPPSPVARLVPKDATADKTPAELRVRIKQPTPSVHQMPAVMGTDPGSNVGESAVKK